jgi:pyruvate/2-oxoacid:ferredoxin oxidoreductase alpha subunit
LPGTSETIFFCNGDEHHEDGTLDESPATEHMIMKRIKKQKAILRKLPEPTVYGKETAAISFIGR